MTIKLVARVAFGWLICLSAYAAPDPSCMNYVDQRLGYSESDLPVRFVGLNVAPWMVSESNQVSGLLAEFSRALSAESGVPQSILAEPYARVIFSLRTGKADFALLHDAEYEGLTKVAEIISGEVFAVGRGRQFPVDSLLGLKGLKVGYIRGSFYGEDFARADYFTHVPIGTMKQGLAMLMRDRLNVLVSSDRTLYWTMLGLNVKPSDVSILYTLRDVTYSLYASNQSEHLGLLRCYKKSIAAMRASGVLARAFDIPKTSPVKTTIEAPDNDSP